MAEYQFNVNPQNIRLGNVYICDFASAGFKEPEMVKPRRVIVLDYNKLNKLLTIIPISSKPCIRHGVDYIELTDESLELIKATKKPLYAVCDMIYTLHIERFDRVKVGRRYFNTKVNNDDLQLIRTAIKKNLRL
ncbi:type II toxin-antitoxin system PemK/MazF family toxin [Aliivibrio fischeri]|uniref:type II toxin-antitoxin system PemK/MazF family toxin n=1 Tax=Aliivibrio fischeri TaxID=668 RepID=UPI0007C46D04|nr:type II toxin-antitoxin system PemK/MazF family toxin [Aliivibrio fischeri]